MEKNEIDISDLPSGVYLMVIHAKEGNFTHKFIKTE
ncbi:T9SS type A sorting domain-containing protein [Bacteroides timonensis]